MLAYGDVDPGRDLPDQAGQGLRFFKTVPVGDGDPLLGGIDSFFPVLFGQGLNGSLPPPDLAAGYDMTGLVKANGGGMT